MIEKVGKLITPKLETKLVGKIEKSVQNIHSVSATNPIPNRPDLSVVKGKEYKKLNEFSGNIQAKFNTLLEVLKKRKPENVEPQKVEYLCKKVLNNPHYNSEADLAKYLNRLSILLDRTTPKGKPLLEPTFANFVADFKNNKLTKEQTQDFIKLVWAGEKGLVPPEMLNDIHKGIPTLRIFDRINPDMIRDVDKLMYAEANGLKPIDVFIPKFKSVISDSEKINKLKVGDMFYVEHSYHGKPTIYCVGGKNRLSDIDIDRETLFKMMPPVARFCVDQGASGTCYQLASYISMMNSPQARVDLFRRIHKVDGKLVIKMPYKSDVDNIFKGKFKDFDKSGMVMTELDNGKFIPKDKKQCVTSVSLIKALEYLYGKHRKYDCADKYIKHILRTQGKDAAKREYNFLLKNMDNIVFPDHINGNYKSYKTLSDLNKTSHKSFASVEDYYKEGGFTNEVFDFFGGSRYCGETLSVNYRTDAKTLNDIRAKLMQDKTIKVFGSKHAPSKATLRETNLLPDKDLFANHGYSIIDYNPKTDVVSYVNPWNSAFVHEMPLRRLAQYINHLSAYRVFY